MPTPTYTLIDSVTLGSSASSVTFSGISATGKGDLILSISGTSGTSASNRYRINGLSTTIYNSVIMQGSGSTTTSYNFSNTNSGLAAWSDIGSGNSFSYLFQFVDYSATDKHKSVLCRWGSAGVEVGAVAGRVATTAAVTSIEIFNSPGGAYYAAGTTFHLYQIVSE
jgi:hypothetical protein